MEIVLGFRERKWAPKSVPRRCPTRWKEAAGPSSIMLRSVDSGRPTGGGHRSKSGGTSLLLCEEIADRRNSDKAKRRQGACTHTGEIPRWGEILGAAYLRRGDSPCSTGHAKGQSGGSGQDSGGDVSISPESRWSSSDPIFAYAGGK